MSNPWNNSNDFEYVKNAIVSDASNIILPNSLSGAELLKKYNYEPFLSQGKKKKNLFNRQFATIAACAACLVLTVAAFMNNGVINENAVPMSAASMSDSSMENAIIEEDAPMLRGAGPIEPEAQVGNEQNNAMAPQNYAGENGAPAAGGNDGNGAMAYASLMPPVVSPKNIVGGCEAVCESILLVGSIKSVDKKKLIDDEALIEDIISTVENAVPANCVAAQSTENIFCSFTFDTGVTDLTFYKEPEYFSWAGDEVLNYSVPSGTFDMLSKMLVS